MIYMTLMYEHSRENEYLEISKTALQVADNVFQGNLLSGLQANTDPSSIYIINSLPFGCWPKKCKKLFFKTQRSSEPNGSKVKNVGFINLPLVKSVCRFFSYMRELKKLMKQNDQRICLVYGLYLPQLLALKMVKRKIKDAYVCLVIDDMPAGFGINKGSTIRRFLKGIKDRMVLNCLNDTKIINSFVFLTEHMSNIIDMGDRNYCVVEGIASSKTNNLIVDSETDDEEKVVFYAGTLNKEFGIGSLLNAFRLIKGDDYRLWICGDGDAKEDVIFAAKEDPRINYYGFVSKEKVNELQEKATVLVNPRKNVGEYVKYSFPSKTIEYMLAQKSIVMYKLAGIPDEYDAHLYYVEDDSDLALANAIIRVCSQPASHRRTCARAAREWLMENKSADAQVKKIMDMIIMDNSI